MRNAGESPSIIQELESDNSRLFKEDIIKREIEKDNTMPQEIFYYNVKKK